MVDFLLGHKVATAMRGDGPGEVTTILQLAAAKTERKGLREWRMRHVLEYMRELHGHWEKFEHCPETFCRAARRVFGVDDDQVELFARSHDRHREPGEDS